MAELLDAVNAQSSVRVSERDLRRVCVWGGGGVGGGGGEALGSARVTARAPSTHTHTPPDSRPHMPPPPPLPRRLALLELEDVARVQHGVVTLRAA